MFELMEKMYIEFTSFKTDIKDIKQDLTSVKQHLTALDGKVDTLNGKVDTLDGKVDKNTLLIEDLTSKVVTIAEVQKSHMDHNERAHNDIVERINEKISVLELSTKNTSKDVKEMKNGLKILK